MEGIRIDYTILHGLRSRRGQIHLVRFAQCIAIVTCDAFDFWLVCDLLEKALAENVIQFVAVWIDRCDWYGDASCFRSDSLYGSIKSRLKICLSDAEVCASKIRDNQTYAVHLSHCYKQVCQGCRRDNSQIRTTNWYSDGVFQITR